MAVIKDDTCEQFEILAPYYEIYWEEYSLTDTDCPKFVCKHTVALVTEEGIAVDYCARHQECKYSVQHYKKAMAPTY